MATETIIILFSFAVVLISFLIGIWARKKVESPQDFIGSTRLFGPIVVGLSSMATIASAFAMVGVPGLIYSTGNAMTFWMLSSAAFAMAYIIVGKKVAAFSEIGNVATLGDLSDLRFNNNSTIKILLCLVLFLGSIAYLASQIQGASELFSHLLGWNPVVTGLVIFGCIIAYTAASGEVGGVLTQAFQGFVMFLTGLIMIIAFFSMTGGFSSVLDVVATAGEVSESGITKTFTPDLINAWGITPGAMALAFMAIPIIGAVGQPQALVRMYSLKDPKEMPKLGLYAGISHAIVGGFAVMMGFGALYLVGSGAIAPLESGDQAIFAFADYVGVYAQLFAYAAVLCAAMSTASLFLSLTANIIAKDLPDALGYEFTKSGQLKASRITIVILGLIAIIFSVTSEEMVAILGTFGWGTLMSATFPVFIIGLLWKEASTEGVISGLSASLILNVISLILDTMGFEWPGGLPYYVFVVSVAIALTVFVSLVTDTASYSGEDLDPKVEAAMDL